MILLNLIDETLRGITNACNLRLDKELGYCHIFVTECPTDGTKINKDYLLNDSGDRLCFFNKR